MKKLKITDKYCPGVDSEHCLASDVEAELKRVDRESYRKGFAASQHAHRNYKATVDAELAKRDARIAELECEKAKLTKRAEFSKWWYGTRWEQIWHTLKQYPDRPLFERVCAIMANGSPSSIERRRKAEPTEEMLTHLEIETDFLRAELTTLRAELSQHTARERELRAKVLLCRFGWARALNAPRSARLFKHYAQLTRDNKPGWWNPTNRGEL